MGEIFTVADIRRTGWRESHEEQVALGYERRQREQAEARKVREVEEKRQEARKAREAETASTDWYTAVDTRIRTHFKDWAWAAIDERIHEHLEIAQKPLVEATGDVFGEFRARLRAEFRHGIEELTDAFGAQLAALEQRLASNDQAARAAQGRAQHDEFRRVIEAAQCLLETKLVELEERLRAVPGKLPVAKTWCPESVSYQAEFVCHEGALYQARKDTAQAPGGSDWMCVARAGVDGRTPHFRDVFNANKTYARFDVAEFDGSSYIAMRDDPGIPGLDDGWKVVARRGGKGLSGNVGPRGRKGERGPRGADAPTIINWTTDRRNYRAIPTMSNGAQGAVLELRGLFEQFVEETSTGS
jgi:hypothetical protein